MQGKVWDIQATCSVLGSNLCRHLPFLHALLGCDTTSRLFGIGKTVGLKKRTQLYQHAEVFYNASPLKHITSQTLLATKKLPWDPAEIRVLKTRISA